MDRAQTCSDTGTELGHPRGWQRPRAGQHLAEVSALDQVHDNGQGVALHDQVTDAHHVRMPDAGQDGTLLNETLNHVRVLGQLRTQHLERQLVTHCVSPPPHLPHGAATNNVLKYIRATQRTFGGHVSLPCSYRLDMTPLGDTSDTGRRGELPVLNIQALSTWCESAGKVHGLFGGRGGTSGSTGLS